MKPKNTGQTAFDQGQAAGRDTSVQPPANPFAEGSAEHNNFEVGRRFGAANPTNSTFAATKPDHDETS